MLTSTISNSQLENFLEGLKSRLREGNGHRLIGNNRWMPHNQFVLTDPTLASKFGSKSTCVVCNFEKREISIFTDQYLEMLYTGRITAYQKAYQDPDGENTYVIPFMEEAHWKKIFQWLEESIFLEQWHQ